MPTKRVWLGHAPNVPQIDQVEFDETAATVLAEGTDLVFQVNGKELRVENPHSLTDHDPAQAGDTSAVLTLLQLAEAAINGSQIPEFAELEATVESPDTDPESPYHRMLVTTREQFHGWPFTLEVDAPHPTIDIDVVQTGAPGQNEIQSFYLTPTPTGGTYSINWNLGSGLETSASIAFDGDADDIKNAMVAGMASITSDNLTVTGSGTSADPWVLTLGDDLDETDVNQLSVDVSTLTGNGEVVVSTVQEGGEASGSGSSFQNDNFTDSDSTALESHVADSTHTWTKRSSGSIGAAMDIQSNEASFSGGGSPNWAVYTLSENTHADFEATCKVTVSGGTNVIGGFVFRYVDISNFMIAIISRTSTLGQGYLQIAKIEGGSVTVLKTGTVTTHAVGTEYTLTLTVSGSSISFASDIDLISVSSSFNQTAVLHGITAQSADGGDGVTFDELDFEAAEDSNEQWSIYTNGEAGTFTLTDGTTTSSALSAASTAAQIKVALEGIYSGSTFTVTGSGVVDDPWIATDDQQTDQIEPIGDGTNLTGGYTASADTVQDGSPPLDAIWDVFIHNTTSGTFAFEFKGRPTSNIAYGATAATVLAALEALAPGDFSGLWSVLDTGIGTADYRITAGGRLAGAPQVLSARNEGLVGTALGIAHTTIQQPTGRNWIDNPVNYRDVATGLPGLPEDGDELFAQIGDESHSMRFGTLTAKLKRFIQGSLFSGHFGLPEINQAGFAEYRATHVTLDFEAGTQSADNPNVLIGVEQGQGSGLIRFKTGAAEVHIRVERTGGPAEDSRPSFCWDGQNTDSTLQLLEGFVGVAVFAFDEADLDHVTQRGGLLRFGEGTDIGAGGFDHTGGETFGRASINGAPVVFGG